MLIYLKRSAPKGPKGRSSSHSEGVTLLQLLHRNNCGSDQCLPQRNPTIIARRLPLRKYLKIERFQFPDQTG